MPTEDFVLAEAGPSYTGTIGNERTTSVRKGGTMGFWKEAMLAGGWTEFGEVHASVTVSVDVASLPVRIPDPADEDDLLEGDAVCTQPPAVSVQDPGSPPVKVWGYDPGIYKSPPCSAFMFGATKTETYDIYKHALAGAAGMNIVSEVAAGDVIRITLSSPAAGTGHNGTRIGGWAGGAVWGGGFSLRSATYRGHFLSVRGSEGAGFTGGNDNAWEMEARVHLNGNSTGGAPRRFDLGLDPAQNSPYNWRICVCPYQFAIWMDGYPDSGSLPGPKAGLISMPWVPEGFTGHSAFAFIVTGVFGIMRNDLAWGGYTWLNSGPWPSTPARLIVPVLRTRAGIISPGVPDRITTTQGLLITDNAYITAPRTGSFVIDNRICGKLWNCCTVSDNYPPSTVYSEMMDARWVHMSSQSWYRDYSELDYATLFGVQKASLWWKVDAGYPVPGTTGPEEALRAVDAGDVTETT